MMLNTHGYQYLRYKFAPFFLLSGILSLMQVLSSVLCSRIFDTTAYVCLCVKYVSESVPTCSAIFFLVMLKSAIATKCAICKRSSVKKDRNCFNRQAPFDLTVEEFNFAVTLDSTISDIVNPKVGKRCLLSLRRRMRRASALK